MVLSKRSSSRGRLLERYVRARIIDMAGIDIGLYDYDRHSSIYYFAVSPDEQIYLRYGGRDERAVDSYLDLGSLELALEAGLEMHEQWKSGTLPEGDRPTPRFPRQIQSLRQVEMARGRCVECHLISDFDALEKQAEGTLDKPKDMFRSPDIRTIGIHLDVPRGLVVQRTSGAAREAGLLSGDKILALDGAPVVTFGDLLYRYDRIDRGSHRLPLTVRRGERTVTLEIQLPELWWVTDISFRRWSVDPVVHFDAEPLPKERRRLLGLPPDGISCEVTRVDRRAKSLGTHTLVLGDLILAVNGDATDPEARDCRLYIQLRVQAGEDAELSVSRSGERFSMTLRTRENRFRHTPGAR